MRTSVCIFAVLISLIYQSPSYLLITTPLYAMTLSITRLAGIKINGGAENDRHFMLSIFSS